MLLGKVNINYTANDIIIKGNYSIEADNLYDILIKLATNKGLILVGDNFAYTEDIRANYRDGELYIPMYMYDTITDNGITVNYNNRIEKIIIHTDKEGYKLNKLLVIPNILIPEAYELNLGNVRLSRELGEKDRHASDLFYKYIASSYGYLNDEMDIFDYIRVQKQYIKKSQKKLLNKHRLEFYGDYIDMDYRDVRSWKLDELKKHFTDEQLQINSPFGLRRMNFELELYTRLYDKVYWDGWTLGTLEKLLNDRIDYLKYKEKDIYLIFKGRWLRDKVINKDSNNQ